jgi:hypothetical protein
MLCRHCAAAPATRPRGLCWGCYHDRGVRARYDSRAVVPAVRDGFRGRPLPPDPTRARPGSPEKVAVLHRRALAGWQLFHPDDARLD